MTAEQTVGAMHMVDILEGAPLHLLTAEQRVRFDCFCCMVDKLGRRPERDDEPLVDEEELRRLLESTVGAVSAENLVVALQQLPGSRLVNGRPGVLPWLMLVDGVRIFDCSPDSRFVGDLNPVAAMWQLMDSVQRLYPSLELEMIDPQVLPERIDSLLRGAWCGSSPALTSTLELAYRNLGWWAVLALALMAAASAGSGPPGWAAWPLYTYVLATSFGGWTLTVLGGCILSDLAR